MPFPNAGLLLCCALLSAILMKASACCSGALWRENCNFFNCNCVICDDYTCSCNYCQNPEYTTKQICETYWTNVDDARKPSVNGPIPNPPPCVDCGQDCANILDTMDSNACRQQRRCVEECDAGGSGDPNFAHLCPCRQPSMRCLPCMNCISCTNSFRSSEANSAEAHLNQTINSAEWQKARKQFESIDFNGDGLISVSEAMQWLAKEKPEQFVAIQPIQKDVIGQQGENGSMAGQTEAAMDIGWFDEVDTNGDKVIEPGELDPLLA